VPYRVTSRRKNVPYSFIEQRKTRDAGNIVQTMVCIFQQCQKQNVQL